MDRLLKKAEAAEMLGVSGYTLDRIVAEGGLPMYKIRGSCRYYEHEVAAYIAAHRTVRCAPAAPQPRRRTKKQQPAAARAYVPGMKVV